MTDYRAKKMKKIGEKIAGMIDELELLLDAELRHVDEYDACEEVCRNMSDADQLLRRAMYAMQQAEACAELEDMQDQMQQNLDHIAG